MTKTQSENMKQPLISNNPVNLEDDEEKKNNEQANQNDKNDIENQNKKLDKQKKKELQEQQKKKRDEELKKKHLQNQEEIKKGNLDVIPPNFDKAKRHREVLRLYNKGQEEIDKEQDDDQEKLLQNNIQPKDQNQNGINNNQREEKKADENEENDKMCSCCGRLQIDFKLDIRTNIIDFSFLGPAYPLFFNFVVQTCLFLLVILLTSGLVNFIVNVKSGTSCQDGALALKQLLGSGMSLQAAKKQIQNMCQLNWISQFTLGNRRNDSQSLLAQEYLNLFTVFALIAFIQYMQFDFRKLAFRIDIKTTTPSDYTVFITQIQKRIQLKIPSHYRQQNEREFYVSYKECFEDYLDKEFQIKDKIFRLSFCFNLDELNQLQSDKVSLIKQIYSLQREKEQLDAKQDYSEKTEVLKKDIVSQIQNKEEEKQKKLERINNIENMCYESFLGESDNEEFMRNNFVGQAFLSFKTQEDSQKFLEETLKFQKCKHKKLKFQGKQLYFERAPDPTDVCWNNIYTPRIARKLRLTFGFFMNILIIFLAGLAIYGLAEVQYSYNKSNSVEPSSYDKFIIQIISFGISMFITAINQILEKIVDIFNKFKKFRMKTSEQSSYMSILTFTQFFNSTVIPLVLLIVVSSADSYYSILYSPTGLILNQNSIFMTNAFMPLLMNLALDFSYRFKNYLRQSEEKKKEKSEKTQREAQELFQDPEFLVSVQYATTLKSMFMNLFYVSVMPLCLVWTFLALAIQYMIAKYLLVNRRVVLVSYGEKLPQIALIMLKFGLIIYASTCYLFLKLSNSLDRPYAPSIVGIVLAVINFFLPLEQINEKLFKINEDQVYEEEDIDKGKTLTYDVAIAREFSTDYAIENPALKNKLINSNDYKIDRKSIQKIKIQGKKKILKNLKFAIEDNIKQKEQDGKIYSFKIQDKSDQIKGVDIISYYSKMRNNPEKQHNLQTTQAKTDINQIKNILPQNNLIEMANQKIN